MAPRARKKHGHAHTQAHTTVTLNAKHGARPHFCTGKGPKGPVEPDTSFLPHYADTSGGFLERDQNSWDSGGISRIWNQYGGVGICWYQYRCPGVNHLVADLQRHMKFYTHSRIWGPHNRGSWISNKES